MLKHPVSPPHPLRVLHVLTGLRVGGAETMLCKLLEAAPPGAWDSRVLTLEGPGPLDARVRAADIPLSTLGLRSGPGPLRLSRALRSTFADGWRPQVIQGWMYHGNLAAWALAQGLPGAALSWNIRHSLQDLRLEKRATALTIRANAVLSGQAQAIICNSPVGATQHRAAGFQERNWHIIPNGFDLEAFRLDPRLRRQARAALGWPDEAFIVGQLARFAPMKDHRTAIRAMAIVARQLPDLKLLFAGPRMTPDNAALMEELSQAGLLGQTRLLGEHPDLPRLIPALDVLVSASAFGEGFPNIIGEALACGVPCAATDVGDTGWALGGHGVLVPPRSPEALAGALQALHRMGPEGRHQLGTRGRAYIERHFTMARIARAYQSLFATLTER